MQKWYLWHKFDVLVILNQVLPQFQIENLEDLLKEKDNQVELARSKLNAVQAQTYTSEGTLSSLEEALADRDKQINQLRDQRDRAEKDIKEEKELHERELTDYKMKIHSLESEVEKLQVSSLLLIGLKEMGHWFSHFTANDHH